MSEDDRPIFALTLRTPDGDQAGMGSLPFEGLEAACCDVIAAIPETAAELLRGGVDPMRCSYLISTPAGELLIERPFSELVRSSARPTNQAARPAEWRIEDLLTRSAELRRRSAAVQARAFASSEQWRSALADARARLPYSVFRSCCVTGTEAISVRCEARGGRDAGAS